MLSSFICCSKGKNRAAVHSETGKQSIFSSPTAEEDHYDFLAPSVYHLQTTFLDTIQQSGMDSTSCNFYQIENLGSQEPGLIRQKGLSVQCPIDKRMGAAYVHCLEPDGEDHVGTATHMLSYAWSYKYQDIIGTLATFCEQNDLDVKRTYIWICAFCNNQHRVVERDVPFDEFKYIFNKRVKGIRNILAMMTPWNDPGYLRRVWCIFEMYSAHSDEDTSIQIIMPPDQKYSLMTAVMRPADSNGRNGLDELFSTLANTKIEDAEATMSQDKDNILRMVEDGPGSSKFNAEINVLLRRWVRDTVVESAEDVEKELKESDNLEGGYSRGETATFLTFCASFFSKIGAHQEALDLHAKGLKIYETLDEDENPKEDIARCYNNLGTEYESLGEYDEALAQHQKCREAFEDIYGKDHENTSTSYFNIGAVLKKMDRIEEALEMYQRSLDIDTRIKGENHIDVAQSLSYIGRIKLDNQDYDGALENFRKSLQIRVKTYGAEHPDAAVGYVDMGILHHNRGEFDWAIDYHVKCMAIYELVLGPDHPDTASVYQNIGAAYFEKGMDDMALEYQKKAHRAYTTSFGPDHPKTKNAMEWIEIVENAMQKE